jgi:hypothetical protein
VSKLGTSGFNLVLPWNSTQKQVIHKVTLVSKLGKYLDLVLPWNSTQKQVIYKVTLVSKLGNYWA